MKSRPGRPSIPPELQALIRRMASENPSWGEERIANELLLKLGIRVSPRTVNKYRPRRPRGGGPGHGRRNSEIVLTVASSAAGAFTSQRQSHGCGGE